MRHLSVAIERNASEAIHVSRCPIKHCGPPRRACAAYAHHKSEDDQPRSALKKTPLAHIGKPFDRLGETLDRFVGIAVFNTVSHAMFDMALENNLAALVQGGFCSINLREHVFARDVFVDHAVNRLHLTDDLLKPAMQVIGIHALSHVSRPFP